MRTGSFVPALRGFFWCITMAGALAGAPRADDVVRVRFDPGHGIAVPHEPVAPEMPEHGHASAPVAGEAPADRGGPGLTEVFGPLGLPCGARFTAEPAPGGTVVLRLDMPCWPAATVTLAHEALSASYRASNSGVIETVFPAFGTVPRYRAVLPGGSVLTAAAEVPDAARYERMATMWEGDEVLAVHAYEYGAGDGDAGHVWHGAPRGARAAEAGRGGYLLALGSADVPGGRRAEVYSFPMAGAARAGAVRFALAADVTPATCGRALRAETLQIGEGLPGAPVALSIALPGCDGTSGVLMLKNLARDLKIAGQ